MEALKDWMDKREMSQEAFGKLIGVTQATVSDYLNGKIEPNFKKLREIRRITKLSLDELIGKKPKNNQGNNGGATTERRTAPG